MLLSVLRSSIEYGSEVWKRNKSQASALELILLGGAKKILGCSSRTCNEAVRGDMGLETLKSRRDKAKLKWWYKLASMSVRRYPRQLFDQEWKVKPRRGRQRKPWNKYVDELFDVLGLPKGELLDDIRKGQCPLSLFLSNVNESVSNSESKKYVEGLNSKVKLELYKTFDKEVEFKRYLHGVSDAGIRLLFKFRLGTHGLNEELGRHRGRNGRTECVYVAMSVRMLSMFYGSVLLTRILGKSSWLSLGPH